MALARSLFLAGCFAAFAVAGPSPASAQQSRTYAPENLRTLSVSDRIRVIRQEYAEQARGRQIPDDQMRFYMDQVQLSNWTFSRIKSDIATSLGNGGWRPPGPGHGTGPGPGMGDSVRCESNDGRSRSCDTTWHGNSRLLKQLSSARCTEGSSWFSGPGRVTVSNGCRAEFGPGFGGGSGPISETVQCESSDGRLRTCGSNLHGQISLQRQLSSTRCMEGSNFGLRNGSVWVDRGCRGVFLIQRGNGHRPPPEQAYSVTCSSDKGRYTTCAWDARRGQPYLLQALSTTACTQGRSWGYSARTGLWVNGGCRGRFGTR
ncbi:MAG: DUF3011 domain-containing protein [Thermomonas sp.]